METLQELELTHKECFTCKVYKLFSEFYEDKRRKNNVEDKCKDCRILKRKENNSKLKQENPEKYKEILRKGRLREATRVSLVERKCKNKWKWRAQNPLKHTAHQKIKYRIRMGYMVKDPCAVCGEIVTEAHHEDYSKPLEVIWLCKIHHMELHRNFNNEIREKLGLTI